MDGEKVLARIVVLNGVGDDELDYVYEILGDLVGSTGGTADFELIKAATVQDADATPERQWLLYRAHALELALEERLSTSNQ